ncbi:MAG TPA: murein biosynthesis integral membrane protein MurJ [Phycisphaerae bacterium]|nr:murein biosynthesis integral membrane protein MurJ [Phycisphaerae bacterium]
MDRASEHGGSKYLGSARLIAACTLISRVTGLARDIVLNRAFGQNWVQDAFNYAFQIPNLFRRLFGEGALSSIFVPTFTDVLDKEGRPAAWMLLGRVMSLIVVALSIITILLEGGALAIWHFSPDGQMRMLQIGLSSVMLPFMISICVLALFSALLNCLGHFTAPALMPIVLNVLNMFGVLVVGPMIGTKLEEQVYGVAWTVLAASVLQLIIIWPVMRRFGVEIRWSLNTRDPHVREMMRMFLPVMVGQGVLLLSVFFDSQICTFLTRGPTDAPTRSFLGLHFAYPLTQGALSAVTNAQRLYQFPLGVLAISLATAAFPLFSLYASRQDFAGLRNTLGQSLRVAVFEGLPSGVVLIVLAEPIVSLLFQHGRYTAEATSRAAWVLRFYALGMPAYCSQQILLRGFYSLKDTVTPMWIGCGLVVLNVAMNTSLVWHPDIREAAFGIGTAVTSTMHVCICVWLLRRRMHGRIDGRRVAASFIRTLLASALAGAAAWFVLRWCGHRDFAAVGRIGARAVRVFLPLGIGAVIYLGMAAIMRMEEVRWLIPKRRSAQTAER